VSNVVRHLAPQRWVEPSRPVRLGPGLGLMLGMSLSADTIRAALIDANGTPYHSMQDDLSDVVRVRDRRRRIMFRLRRAAVSVLSAGLQDRNLWASENQQSLRLLGASIAWPAPVDREMRSTGQHVLDATWRETRNATELLPAMVAEALGPPFEPRYCHVLNDANAAALAVAFDQSRLDVGADPAQWRVMLVVFVGHGLGAATMLLAPPQRSRLSFVDSILIAGSHGVAGEFGHLPIGRRLIDDLNHANPYPGGLAEMDYDGWYCS